MIKIAIIGVGGISARHMQAIAECNESFEIYLIDPNKKSILNAENIFKSTRKLILSPMEKLMDQRLNTLKTTVVNLDLTCDNLFKPGYYNAVKEFLFDGKKLMNLNMLISRIEFLKNI